MFYEDRDSLQVREWRQWSESRGVRFINMFPAFFGLGPKLDVIRDYFIPFDAHWNAAGNRVAAGAYSSLAGLPTCDPQGAGETRRRTKL